MSEPVPGEELFYGINILRGLSLAVKRQPNIFVI